MRDTCIYTIKKISLSDYLNLSAYQRPTFVGLAVFQASPKVISLPRIKHDCNILH